ncbi:MAG: hypothetical protein JWP11_3805 [Frankiales bacterium]|nr:hypothetical protein [Frankiales bacterium]
MKALAAVLPLAVGALIALEVDRRRPVTKDGLQALTPGSFAQARRELYDDMRAFGGQS